LCFWKIKENRIWDICVDFHSISFGKNFPKYFSLLLVSKTLSFHLSYIFYPKLLGSLFCVKKKKRKEKRKKREVFEVVVVNLLSCNHPFICESLFGRGDRVIGL